MKKKNYVLILIFVSVFIRITLLIISTYKIEPPGSTIRFAKGLSDDYRYDQLALSLLDGEGMKIGERGQRTDDLRRPVFYPLFLAATYKLFGYRLFFIQLIQILVGALSVLVLYYFVKTIFSEKIAFFSSLLFAFYLPHCISSIMLMTEVWTTFFLLLLVFWLSKATHNKNWLYWVLSGLAFALLCLTRQFYKYFFFIIIFYIIYFYRNNLLALGKRVILFFLPVIFLILPWMLHVRSVTGVYQFDNLRLSPYNVLYGCIFQTQAEIFGFSKEEKRQVDQIGHNFLYVDVEKAKNYVKRFIQTKPHQLIVGLIYRPFVLMWIPSFWVRTISQEEKKELPSRMTVDFSPLFKRRLLKHKLILVYLGIIFMIGIASVIGFLFNFRKNIILTLVIFYTLIGFSLTRTEFRYGLPIHPFMLMFFLVSIIQFVQYLKMRNCPVKNT